MEDEKVSLTEYNKLVNPNYIEINNFGKWVQFKNSFPMLIGRQTFIEILCDNGNPTIHSIWCDENNTVRIRDYDFHRELLLWHLEECFNLYWRYMPDPPGNYGYSVG